MRCRRCGRAMPWMEAAVWLDDEMVWVCHPDDEDLPDCYHLVTVYGQPLPEQVPVAKEPA